MDILKEFAEKHDKVNICDFFHDEYDDIHLHNTQIEPQDERWEGLRSYWTTIVDEFAEVHSKKKVSKDVESYFDSLSGIPIKGYQEFV